MSHLAARSLLVTGAASGFGRIIATDAAAAGARVVAVDIDGDAVDALAAELRAQGGQVVGRRADVTRRTELSDAVAAGVEAFGFVDVAVLNAGIMPLAFFADHEQAADAWDRCIDVNFRGVLNGIAAVHDHMIELGRGHVVCMSSIYGNHAVPGSGVYSATKAAVNVLADTLRLESQGRIKVTIVRPTGVAGTNLGASIVNGGAVAGILGAKLPQFGETMGRMMRGELTAAESDRDDIGYWAITPADLARQVLAAIDQPWGIDISDLTVRASGEHFQM